MAAKVSPELKDLTRRIGQFIRYWGFSRVDGEAWAHLYLSPTPLSAAQLQTRLSVSKAMMSVSLKQLVKYGVVRVSETGRHGTAYYEAAPHIDEVIEGVLRARERRMLADISASARRLEKRAVGNTVEGVAAPRALALREMCESAETLLEQLVFAGRCLNGIAHVRPDEPS